MHFCCAGIALTILKDVPSVCPKNLQARCLVGQVRDGNPPQFIQRKQQAEAVNIFDRLNTRPSEGLGRSLTTAELILYALD